MQTNFSNCPICFDPLINMFAGNLICKRCYLRPSHYFEVIYKSDVLSMIIYGDRIIDEQYNWQFNRYNFCYRDLTKSSNWIVLPYFYPDFSNLPILLNKLAIIRTFQ